MAFNDADKPQDRLEQNRSYRADPEYGRRIAEGLGLDALEVERLAAIHIEEFIQMMRKATS
jgi:hypothetical protein